MSCNDLLSKNYFEKQLLIDTWVKPNITIEVKFFRRSLQDIINETTNYFVNLTSIVIFGLTQVSINNCFSK
jgi:hypothetical protein